MMRRKNISHHLKISLLILTIIAIIYLPSSAKAALNIISVNPSSISNLTDNSITISGTDFISGTIVSLTGYGALSTSFFSSTTLMALVPAGVPAGIYSIKVTNPDTTSVTLDNALTITATNPTASASQTAEPPGGYERPVLVVNTYSMSQDKIKPGDYFILYITLYNAGQHYAKNIVANFTPGDLIPRETGGVVAVGEIAPGNRLEFAQPFILSDDAWNYVVSSSMLLNYADETGILFSETFVISLPVFHPYSSSTSTPTPTASPTPSLKPQLVISSYSTDLTPLQPGIQFNLSLKIHNSGSTTAKRVTMIVGGGSSASGSDGGTQQPGGISGGSGEFTNFAPIGSSNVQSLGELNPGASITAIQPLIVNTSISPGAYPLKISFTYTDALNHAYVDDQVITLLVYRLPIVDISFYQALPPLYTGMPNLLPLQVVNLGRNSVVLGNMRVQADTGQFTNNSILVGTLESGGYFTLDANYIPEQAGEIHLNVTIDYTNDFNQSQVISKTVTVDVIDQPIIEPPTDGGINGGGEIPSSQPETFLQKIWRFILGLIGLDSGVKNTQGPGELQPVESTPSKEQPIVVPARPLKGP